MKSNFWFNWARIAIAHENEAALARARVHVTYAARGDASEIREEMEAGLVTVVAVYFALDALHADVAPLIGRHPDTRAGRGRAWGYMLETFRQASARANQWQPDLQWLVALRDDAVHFHGEFEEPVPHPSLPTHVSPQVGEFSTESCRRAVDFLIRVLTDIFRDPGGQSSAAVREWAASRAHTMDELEGLRRTATATSAPAG